MANLYINGMHQIDLYNLINDINTKLIALYTQLVADTTVNDATYLTACGPGALPASMSGTGMDQGEIVTWLNTVVVGWNAAMAILDGDSGVTATTYVATQGLTDAINPTTDAANLVRSDGMFQGDLHFWLNAIITTLNATNAKLDADSLQLSDYVSLFNVSDTVI